MLGPYLSARNFGAPKRASEKLPQDWPDYLAYMTREALKSVTGSMNEIFSGTENFFFQVNRRLAYERAMRDLAAWMPPMAAPWMAAMPQSWTGFSPHPLGAMPIWLPHSQQFPLMNMTTPTMPPYAFPPYTASLAPYYNAMSAPAPSLWSFNPHLTRYM